MTKLDVLNYFQRNRELLTSKKHENTLLSSDKDRPVDLGNGHQAVLKGLGRVLAHSRAPQAVGPVLRLPSLFRSPYINKASSTGASEERNHSEAAQLFSPAITKASSFLLPER